MHYPTSQTPSHTQNPLQSHLEAFNPNYNQGQITNFIDHNIPSHEEIKSALEQDINTIHNRNLILTQQRLEKITEFIEEYNMKLQLELTNLYNRYITINPLDVQKPD